MEEKKSLYGTPAQPHRNSKDYKPDYLVVSDNEGALDTENERSLISMLPVAMQESLKKAKNFFLHDLSENSLRRNIKNTPEYKTVNMLRQSFWHEYQHTIDVGAAKMQMTRVYQGICQSEDFYRIMAADYFAALVFTKPQKQAMRERYLLDLALDRMEEILTAETVNADGIIVDPKGAKLQMDVFKHIDERVQGGVVKKVSVQSEQRSLNVNVNQETTSINVNEIHKMEDLNQQLIELREKTRDIGTMSIPVEYLEETTSDE